MDETKITYEMQIKVTAYMIDNTDTQKTATFKIQNYNTAIESETTVTRIQRTIGYLINSTGAAAERTDGLMYQDTNGNQYKLVPPTNTEGNYALPNVEEVALIDTTEVTLTDIGWNN